jgi:hemerythrin-like metal-binding protein
LNSLPIGEPAPFLDWSDDFVLGHPLIDPEHLGLFELVNRLAAAVMAAEDNGEAAAIATELLFATHRHFDHEEVLMRQHGFVHLDRHHEQHSELLAQLESLRDRLAVDFYLARPQQTLHFLRDWFMLHIAHSDRKFVDFVKASRAPG